MLFLDKTSTKSYYNACWIYISMKNTVNLFKKSITDSWVSFVGDRIPMDPDTIPSLLSRIRMDLLPYCEDGSMIPADLSANCEDGSVIWTDPGSRSLGSNPGIRFRNPWACLLLMTPSYLWRWSWLLKELSHLEKVANYTRIHSMPKCWGRSTEHVCNSSSKNIAYFARYWGLKYLGLWHPLRCAFYSTVLVLRQTIYDGRLLLVIALVITSC